MVRYLLLFSVLCSFNLCLDGQCVNTKILQEVHGKISNDHRANNAFTYGMVSYQSHEDNYYYDDAHNPLFYLGYAKSLWVSGTDPAGNLKVSANTFPTLVQHDFMPGPLDRATGLPIDNFCRVFNKVWKISQFEVLDHISKFEKGTLDINNIPTNILEWPAKGNPHMPDFTPDFELAPFADIAEDGIYNAVDGDYPLALEESRDFIPHEFSFIVFNDATFHTSPTAGVGLNMEFHQMNYVISCVNESEAEQSVFTRIKYINLGQEELQNFKLCLYEDNDLACNVNDYQGVDRELNCNYFYNKDGATFQGACHDPDVPNDNGAIRSTVYLSNDILAYRHFYNPGVGTPIIPLVDPSTAEEYYNLMNGLWRDGTPLSTGGIGFNPASTDTTMFSYPDKPTDTDGWSMQTANQVIPTDARSLTTLVSGTLLPGQSGTVDFVDHFLYDPSRKQLEVFEVWPEKINALKEDWQAMVAGTFDCGSDFEICETACVWPGDANDDLAVTTKDFLQTGILAGKSAMGPSRSSNSTNWFGFNSDDWATELSGTNAKYGDANGNGVVNFEDFTGIEANFGRERADYIASEERLNVLNNFGLKLEFETNFVDLSTAQLFDQIVNTNVSLEDSGLSIHGLSFDMRYDTNMIAAFVKLDDMNNEVFQYEFAHMANSYREGNELLGDNKIQYALTNYNGQNSTPGGRLLRQNLFIRNNAVTPNADGRDTVVVHFYNVCAVDANGNLVALGAQYDTLVIANLMVDPNVMSSTQETETSLSDFQIFPNPATDKLQLLFQKNISGEVNIYNSYGQMLKSEALNNEREKTINLRHLDTGIYYLHYSDKQNRVVVKKFVKTK